jgi:rhomboid protease GluP
MDLNTIALWFSGFAASSLFLRSARAARRPWDWLVVSALVLAAAGAGWFYFRDSAGYVAGALTLLLILMPTWMSNVANRANRQGRYGRARAFASLAAVLHPFGDLRATPRLLQAFELAHSGKVAEAEALLQLLAGGTGNVASNAAAHRLRILGRWRDAKSLIERSAFDSVRGDPARLAVYLRALAELGQVDELADFMLAHEATLFTSAALEMALLSLFAFTGQIELTRQVLDGKGYGQETVDFWLALATQYAGQTERARQAFGRLRQAEDAQLRARAEERYVTLVHAEREAPPSARTLSVVQYFARAFADKQNLVLNAPTRRTQRRVTGLLLIANALVYVVGSLPLLQDTRSGFAERWAFFAPDIFNGEWWRIFTYLFVHANAIHLLMNMGGLWALGPFVERAFGRLRFSLIYLISGCTGSAAYLALSWFGRIEPEPLVGASGCIMGLLGATAAVMLRAWIRQRAPMARQIFLRLLAVVALQVAFDRATPQVAGLAHALGLLGGFVFGLLLHEIVSPKRSVARLA